MKTIKVSEATGPVLNWMVAKCEGLTIDNLMGGAIWAWSKDALTDEDETIVIYRPSTDWSQGGPILERGKITVCTVRNGESWAAKGAHNYSYGPTPLIAAMRCFCISKLGDEVEVPDELLE